MVTRSDAFVESRRSRLRRATIRPPLVDAHSHVAAVLEQSRLEVVPMKSLERAASELLPHSLVSVTCSPAKSIEATLHETENLLAAGHDVVPHISARMVQSNQHLGEITDRLSTLELDQIFVVAGDADPPGIFGDTIDFFESFLALDPSVSHIGITGYPDSHPQIDPGRLHEALHRKQQMILGSGRSAHVSTQMCFNPDRIRHWLRHERAAGLSVPVHLGIAGVIDRSKLMATGMRLGVGSSLRYLSKNRSAMGVLMKQRHYQPDQLLRPMASELTELGIEALHIFTFNQVSDTEVWRQHHLGH